MMIRQSLVDERLSALHHHALQSSPGDNNSDMSKSSRRLPPPVASRVVIKKNSSLPLGGGDDANVNSLSSSPTSPTPTVDPRSRIDHLERNLRFVQQQHDITLADLHNEINRLQLENRDLHFHLINIQPSSQQERKPVAPNIRQLSDLTQTEPILEKRLQEVQRIHFEQQLEELRARLVETEQKNDYLARTIEEISKTSSRRSPPPSAALPVLLPDPSTLPDAHNTRRVMINADEDKTTGEETTDVDYRNLLKIAHNTHQQQTQEIAMMRAVLREILYGERLSSTSKILIRDCLTATSGESSAATKPTSTPIDMFFSGTASNSQQLQQRSVASSSTAGRTATNRQSGGGQIRPVEQRLVLPPIAQGGTPSPLHDPLGGTGSLHSSLSQTNYVQQPPARVGETSIARRERRTQELQRTRLTRNLYH